MPTRVRYIVPHGHRVWLRIYWGDGCGPSTNCHNAMLHLFDHAGVIEDSDTLFALGGRVEDHLASEWPLTCEDCGAVVPPIPDKIPCPCGCGDMRLPEGAPHRQVFRKTLYATPDRSWIGMPTVGDAYYADWYDCAARGGQCVYGWTNCVGIHIIVHVPDPGRRLGRAGVPDEGHWWDLAGRASNCTLKDDTLHRCWVAHGTPEAGDLHVDKAGLTCNAGGGSLDTGRWHGVLHNGVLTP